MFMTVCVCLIRRKIWNKNGRKKKEKKKTSIVEKCVNKSTNGHGQMQMNMPCAPLGEESVGFQT